MFYRPPIALMRRLHATLMDDEATIFRGNHGVLVEVAAEVPCRVGSTRLMTEPVDPYDANTRSIVEWGFTFPLGTDVRVGDRVLVTRLPTDLRPSVDVFLGEVLVGDTHSVGVRAWGTAPKTAVPTVSLVLHRIDDDGLDTVLVAQTVQLVFKRVDPFQVPIRYRVGASASMQGGTIIGDLTFDVQPGDRFAYADPILGMSYTGFVTSVLPTQSQRVEATFLLDVIGPR
jgi:hypothetical protein